METESRRSEEEKESGSECFKALKKRAILSSNGRPEKRNLGSVGRAINEGGEAGWGGRFKSRSEVHLLEEGWLWKETEGSRLCNLR